MALSAAGGVRLLTASLAQPTTTRMVTTSASRAATLPFLSGSLPATVEIYEVGPRDGLQNEKAQVPVEVKTELIERLVSAGLKLIEATSFVSPNWVPQLADAGEVMARIPRPAGVRYPVLTPNLKGYQNAVQAGAKDVAVFAAASEAFSMKNTNCTIAESLERFRPILEAARGDGVSVRGYVSCVVGCPYQGYVDPVVAANVAKQLYDMGCYEVSMADTTGVGTPASVARMFEETKKLIPVEKLAAHMHDTYGQALANILASMQCGVSIIDTSIAGLGGCPYAKGATGNVATEDVVYMLDGFGIHHGLNMDKLLAASDFISRALGRENSSRAARALLITNKSTL